MLKFEADVARVICDVEGRLLVAVSGGADSTALLHCLCRLKRDCVVAHCNFHLRGAESDRDQSYVEELCRQHGVSLNVIDFDVEEYCRNHPEKDTIDIVEYLRNIEKKYPELKVNLATCKADLEAEENRFNQTLDKGEAMFNKVATQLKEHGQTQISGKTAFKLYDTFGFPFEMTLEMAEKAGLSVDKEGFEEANRKHQELSRTTSAGAFKAGLQDNSEVVTRMHTATHLLHAALHQVLGPTANQKGSNITAERLRFDFTWPEPMTAEQKDAVEKYKEEASKVTEIDRMASNREKTGVLTGSYAINPLTGESIPVWISDYVLAGYGTGAIMAVPAHDSRDYAFAKHFGLEIRPLIEGADVSEESFDAKEGIMMNSPRSEQMGECDLVLNGLTVKEAIARTKEYIKEKGLGHVKVNYRLRDAIFSRQRYWGEPFPVYYKEGMPYMVPESCLPIELPEVAKFLPTESGEPPLGHATVWAWDTVNNCVVENEKIDNVTIFPLELNTMPGFAGSSAYYLRYMDPRNHEALVDEKIGAYWQNVDLYVGGSEHATGHLIYSRFWNKFLFDLGYSKKDEPFQKLVNQGMIQGRSNFVYRIKDTNTFVSLNLKKDYDVTPLHVDVNIVTNDVLDLEAFKAWRPEYADAEFILEDGKYICGWAVEKMSKSMFNVVNPDMIVEKYGADTLRMYEMFLGPVEQSKPWDTNGIDGCHRFLKKFWSLFYGRGEELLVTDEAATKEELKSLHKLLKKVTGDIENFSYNTSISAFMICVNELSSLKCTKREVLMPLVVALAPFAPHVCEELFEQLGGTGSVCDAQWPAYNEEYLKEDSVVYSISFNGKTRFTMELAADLDNAAIQETVLANENTQKYIDGKTIRKVIVVPKKIVNIVVA